MAPKPAAEKTNANQGERLQKVLARAGIASRRAAETLIANGRVRVNGQPVLAQGLRVDPARDVVEIDGTRVGSSTSERETWAVNKPVGMITTLRDPQGRPTVRRLVEDLEVRLHPVGRLDRDAEGLLLMSNDGELTHRLMHPSFGVERTYEVSVKGRVSRETLARLALPVDLEDGPVEAKSVELIASGERQSELRLILAEGRNHVVKRLCAAVGHEVVRLRRTSYGTVSLGQLAPGQRRRLGPAELRRLRRAVGLE